MKNKCPIQGKIAYLVGLTLRAKSAIFGSGCGSLGALEQYLPGIFVRSVEEPAQGLVLCRIKLPQVEGLLLAREDPTDEHDLDYIDELDLLVHKVLDAGLESGQLFRFTLSQARLFPRGEPCREARSEFGGCQPFRVTRLGDVEPPRLPPLYGLHEGALEPSNGGHFAHHGSAAFRLLAAPHLRLDIEGLQPQAEVGPDAEESLAYDDERRDVEDEIQGQIMKVQPIIEHKAVDEWMEG